MYLSSITIQGFKSFAKKVVIDLSQDVTGVVGPNGSGKSNVAEAIRFVLGEQSMKGLRSKSGSDLIFKGSPHLSHLSRASVSINLNNKEKRLASKVSAASSEMENVLNNFINLDEIILTREIYADGQSEYTINNTKVRLKDVQELLALAQISAAGHTIINQGEADKVLLSNAKDRREMIEESLGLRIYHMRIKDSKKKLEKVSTHLKEIDLLRRENLPHLNFLKKQIEKLEKREGEIEILKTNLKLYLHREDLEISNLSLEIKNTLTTLSLSQDQNIDEAIIFKKSEIAKLKEEIENTRNTQHLKVSGGENLESAIIPDYLNAKLTDATNHLSTLESRLQDLEKQKLSKELEINFLNKRRADLESKIKEAKEITEKANSDDTGDNTRDLEFVSFSKRDLNSFKEERDINWQEIFDKYDVFSREELSLKLKSLKQNEQDFFNNILKDSHTISRDKETFNVSTDSLTQEIENISTQIKTLTDERDLLLSPISNLNSEIENEKLEIARNKNEIEKIKREALEKSIQKENEAKYDSQNKLMSLELDLSKLESKKELIESKKNYLNRKEADFSNLLEEMKILIGISVLSYKSLSQNNQNNNSALNENLSQEELDILNNTSQQELSKKIERSKIKIEETGVVNAGEIVEEYNILNDRDEFLVREIDDLTKSKISLEVLISDLEGNLLLNFNDGLKTINENFNNYFGEMFNGGKASLSLEEAKKDKEEGVDIDEEIEKVSGIEINVSLPQKKVKDLQMLSGGERALTSIALIFAMSSINHPPFMILDETDAALDEANARKYGKMIQKLSEKSKLLVITHNRETMNQCDVLYGVTVGAEGCSKLLSIKFDDATQYAK